MRYFLVLMFVTLISACGQTDRNELHSGIDSLEEHRQFWLNEVVQYCQGFPSKENCDDGDATIFNGLLCLSGDDRGCDAVKRAQAADGSFWRSPRRVGGGFESRNSFSRDQATGVIAYLIKTGDREAAQRWVRWIQKNRACSVEKPFGGGCLVRAPTYRFCRNEQNQTCTLTPGWWAILGKIYEYLGLEPVSQMKKAGDLDDKTLVLETKLTETGYPLHLKASSVLVRQFMGINRNLTRQVAEIIEDKQPDNPYFQYLHYGASHELLDYVLELCPSPGDSLEFRRFQWAWERDTSSQAWQESMGWDCLFLTNLISQEI